MSGWAGGLLDLRGRETERQACVSIGRVDGS